MSFGSTANDHFCWRCLIEFITPVLMPSIVLFSAFLAYRYALRKDELFSKRKEFSRLKSSIANAFYRANEAIDLMRSHLENRKGRGEPDYQNNKEFHARLREMGTMRGIDIYLVYDKIALVSDEFEFSGFDGVASKVREFAECYLQGIGRQDSPVNDFPQLQDDLKRIREVVIGKLDDDYQMKLKK